MDALLTPAFGTVVWATVAFLVVMFLLRKMASVSYTHLTLPTNTVV